MPPVVKVAAVQTNPKFMQNEKNLGNILLKIRDAAVGGAQLIVFPECALTGYMFTGKEEALSCAETIPGPATDKVGVLCKELGLHVVFGLIEKDGDRIYNSAAFVGPGGLVGKYRKIHLPFFGLDRFVEKGDIPFEVHKTPVGNIGILICYDMTIPESARVLALKGADIIVVITNWPREREIVAKSFVNTRALENLVHIIASDRVGVERKARFLGMSKIVNARGMTKAQAGVAREEIIFSDFDLAFARNKRLVLIPGIAEMDFINDRRPEFYDEIIKPKK